MLSEFVESGEVNEFRNKIEPENSEKLVSKKLHFYSLEEAVTSDGYEVIMQKNDSSLLGLKYVATPISEVLMDFYGVKGINFKNSRFELDTILLNIHAASKILTYAEGKRRILGDIQRLYNFKIKQKRETKEIYSLNVYDPTLLKKYIEETEGGGMVKRKNNKHEITRLSLVELSEYFQNRLEVFFEYNGADKIKYNFTLEAFKGVDDLTIELEKIGLKIEKNNKSVIVYEVI